MAVATPTPTLAPRLRAAIAILAVSDIGPRLSHYSQVFKVRPHDVRGRMAQEGENNTAHAIVKGLIQNICYRGHAHYI